MSVVSDDIGTVTRVVGQRIVYEPLCLLPAVINQEQMFQLLFNQFTRYAGVRLIINQPIQALLYGSPESTRVIICNPEPLPGKSINNGP